MRLAFLADHRGVAPESFAEDFITRTRVFLERRMRIGDMRSWLAEDRGSCIGIVSMLLLEMAPKPDDRRNLEGYIINLYVRPNHRGEGVGSALFDACLADAAASGVRRLLLHSTDAGRAMYDRFGFGSNDRWMELSL